MGIIYKYFFKQETESCATAWDISLNLFVIHFNSSPYIHANATHINQARASWGTFLLLSSTLSAASLLLILNINHEFCFVISCHWTAHILSYFWCNTYNGCAMFGSNFWYHAKIAGILKSILGQPMLFYSKAQNSRVQALSSIPYLLGNRIKWG